MSDTQSPDADKALPRHHGVGKVEQIGKDEITISHGPITSLQWGAMTMGFKVSSTGLQRNIGIGDRVAFDIQQGEDGSFEIVAIAPTSGAPKPENKPMGGMKAPAGVAK